jgi:hypothetical protein
MKVAIRKSPRSVNPNISLLLSAGIIRKSHGLYHHGSGEMLGMGSPEVNREDHEHPWYQQFDDEGTQLRAHHPIHAQHPVTGELEFNEDGTPKGMHPVDAMMKHLSGFFQDNYNFKPEQADTLAKRSASHAIEIYNSEHADDSNHRLPGIDSVQWRRNYMVPYDNKSSHPTERRLRGAEEHFEGTHRPMGTYNLNSQNPSGAMATGMWADSGLIPMNRQMGQVLHHVNEQMGQLQGQQAMIPRSSIDKLEYVQKPHISVNKMTDGAVTPLSGQHAFHMQNMGRTPDDLAPEDHMMDNPGQLVSRLGVAAAGLHPAMTAVKMRADGSVGTSAGRKGGEETGKVARARRQLGEAGIELSDEEFAALMTMPLSSMLFGRPGETGSKNNSILRNLEAAFDINRESEEYKQIYSALQRAGNRHGGHRGQSEFAKRYATLAHLIGPDELHAHDYTHPGHQNTEEHDALAQRVIQAMAGEEHLHDYSQELKPLRPNIPQVREHGVHEGFHDYILTADELAPPHNMGRQLPQDDLVEYNRQLQQRLAPQPALRTRQATPEETAQRETLAPYTAPQLQALGQHLGQPMSDLRAQQMRAGSQPGQTFFDVSQPDPTLVYRSEKDIRSAIGEIQKAMEKIQMKEASNETSIQKYLPRTPLTNSLDVGIFAKSMNLTTHDIWGINSSKGDWDDVAKSWDVSCDMVKAIKVAMGAYHG